MGAWAALVHSNGSDEHLKLCEEAMREVQQVERAKCLRQIAEEISKMSDEGFSALEVSVVFDNAKATSSHRGDLPVLEEVIQTAKEAYKP